MSKEIELKIWREKYRDSVAKNEKSSKVKKIKSKVEELEKELNDICA